MNGSKHLELKKKRLGNYIFPARKIPQDFVLESMHADTLEGISSQHQSQRTQERRVNGLRAREPEQGFPGLTSGPSKYWL